MRWPSFSSNWQLTVFFFLIHYITMLKKQYITVGLHTNVVITLFNKSKMRVGWGINPANVLPCSGLRCYPLSSNTGAPQGCASNPFLFTFFTEVYPNQIPQHNFTATQRHENVSDPQVLKVYFQQSLSTLNFCIMPDKILTYSDRGRQGVKQNSAHTFNLIQVTL